jgi:hypothetical protein
MNLIAEGWAEEWALLGQTTGVAKVIVRQQPTSVESASTATLRTQLIGSEGNRENINCRV